MITIGINQPHYLPWRIYYERIRDVDIHVVLDHVQFEKNSLVNRNKICNINQNPFYLTVPLLTKGNFGNLAIKNICYSENIPWKRKHLNSIKNTLLKNSKDPIFLNKLINVLEKKRSETNFLKLLKELDLLILKKLNIKTKIIFSSELSLKKNKSEMILEICNLLDANNYLSGMGGKDYLKLDEFDKNNIKVLFVDDTYINKFKKYRSVRENLSILVDF